MRDLDSDPGHVAYARRLARTMSRKIGVPPDVAESAAMYGLVLAARSYRDGMGKQFVGWAHDRIVGKILDDYSRWTGRDRVGCPSSPAAPLDCHDPEATCLHDPGPLPGEEMESHEEFEARIAPLPPRLRALMRALFLDARTAGSPMAVAAAWRVSEARIYELRGHAMRLLAPARPPAPRRDVRDGRGHLPDKIRRVRMLRAEGRSLAEIGHALGISKAHVARIVSGKARVTA